MNPFDKWAVVCDNTGMTQNNQGKLMKTYTVACFWSMAGEMEIEATNLEEAIERACESGFPSCAEYVDDSFEVNYDCTKELNQQG